MSIGYYVACRKPVPRDPEMWLRRVLRSELEAYGFERGDGWDGCTIGGVTVNVVTERWGQLAAGWTPKLAAPAEVLYFGGTASRDMDLWERLSTFVLPVLADEAFGVVFFEDGKAIHRAFERSGRPFVDKLTAVLGDPRELANTLIRDGGALQPFERLEAIELVVKGPGAVAPRVEALLGWFEVRTDSVELLGESDLDLVPFLERARPDLGARVEDVIARLRARADEREAATYAYEHRPSTIDLAALLRTYAGGDARAERIVRRWCFDFELASAAGSEAKTRERVVLGDTLIALMQDAALRPRLQDAVMWLVYDEGLPRLRALLDPGKLAELERIGDKRGQERRQYTEASDWSDV